MKNKTKIYIDLRKLSEEQIRKIENVIKYKIDEIECYPLLIYLCDVWNQCKKNINGRTELTYPEFIKLFEGGEGENTNSSVGWIDAQEEQPLCISTGDWDGKQSDIVLAETFTGKKFLAQCYEGLMDGSKFYDWYQVDEINSNDWLITESVSRWMKIPF